MSKESLNNCLNEILTDEQGNAITPSCGLEKLLSELCECAPESITDDEIDEITKKR